MGFVMSAVTAEQRKQMREEALFALAQRIQEWKLREGKSYFSMPAPLWNEAVRAAHEHGAPWAAHLLGINRDDLERRMELARRASDFDTASTPIASEPPPEDAQFIELPGVAQALAITSLAPQREPADLGDVLHSADSPETAAVTQGGEAIVEVTATDGSRLTVHIPVSHLDITALVQQFRGGV
jgi:hypothetical protein